MCPGGTVVAATVGAGPRRHQRHEPIFAQRAQRQCRHRGRHHAGRGLSRPSAGRHRPAAALGKRAPSTPAAAPMPRRRSWWAISSPGGLDRTGRGGPVLSARRDADRSVRLPAGLRHRRDPRGAARLRPPDPGFRPGRCGADRRGDAHLLAHPHPARRGFPEPQHAGPLSGGRRRGLCRRHSFGGGRRHQGGGSRRPVHRRRRLRISRAGVQAVAGVASV